ncbi:transposase [Chloroflexota bacterium]
MTTLYGNKNTEYCQDELNQSPLMTELEDIFASIPYKHLLDTIISERIRAFSPLGRSGYLLESLLKGLLASYYLNLRSNAHLVRRLQEDPILAITCGFDPRDIPHRSTFSRFQKKLSNHQVLVDRCLNQVTSELRTLLPGFGEVVAVDSTPVRSHCNPNKLPLSDLEAGWIAKGGSGKNKDWRFGYRLHMVVDANSELPISKKLTLAKVQDVQEILPLLKETKERLPWFAPNVVLADKGYDSGDNCYGIVKEFDASPVIPLSPKTKELPPEITGSPAAPYCPASLPLIYRSWDKNKGIQYACPAKVGRVVCPLAQQCGLKMIWVRPVHDYRRFGYRVKRGTEEWAELYHLRGSIERTYSRLKQTRRLEGHCFRGFNSINIHATLSVLVMQSIALSKARAGQMDELRVCVRRVG